jgi:hypothetical protein
MAMVNQQQHLESTAVEANVDHRLQQQQQTNYLLAMSIAQRLPHHHLLNRPVLMVQHLQIDLTTAADANILLHGLL